MYLSAQLSHSVAIDQLAHLKFGIYQPRFALPA